MGVFPEISSGGSGGGGDMFKSTYNPDGSGIVEVSVGGTGATTASGARTNLDIQAQSSILDALSGVSSNGLISKTGAASFSSRVIAAGSSKLSVSGEAISLGSNVYALADSKTISEAKSFTGGIKTDAINENTSATGVTIDGVLVKDGGIVLDEQSDPSTPSSGKVRLYAKDGGGISKLYFKNDDGTVYAASRSPSEIYALSMLGNVGDWFPNITTPTSSGIIAGSNLVSLGAGTTTLELTQKGTSGRLLIGTSSGNYRGYYGDAATCLNLNPIIICSFTLNRATDIRAFIGITDAAFTSTDTPTGSFACFRYSTVASDTNLMAINGASASTTATSTGAASSYFDTQNECITCVIDVETASSIKFYAYDTSGTQIGSTVTHTTNLPSSTTSLFPYMYVETRAASNVTFDFYGFKLINRGYYLTSYPI